MRAPSQARFKSAACSVHDAPSLELPPLPAVNARSPAAVLPAPRLAPPNLHREPPPDAAGRWRAVGAYLWRFCAVVCGISVVLYGYHVLLAAPGPGHYTFSFPPRFTVYGVFLLTAATLLRRRPAWAMAAALLPCVHHLYETCPALVPYVAALLPAMYWLLGQAPRPTRRESRRFWIGLFLGVVLLPKLVQNLLGFDHGSFLDVNQNLFAGLFLRYAYYYYERRRGFVPAGGFWEHCAYLLFIPQITGMLNLPPSEMAARWGFGGTALRRGFESLGRAGLKIPAILYFEGTLLPAHGYARGYEALRGGSFGALWACLLLSYLHWYLLISAKFDLMISLFRFFGLNADDNFRWPLLATSPVELWRRWNLYNRKLLLKFVYFPLGGSYRCVYRNILLTFLASALLLHTGFLGSPWWWVDPMQLCDWLLYFAAQGLLVCGAYWWMQRPFWDDLTPGQRWPLRIGGWAFTLISSAWLHVLPLAAGNLLNEPTAAIPGLTARLALMLRAAGLLPGTGG